jgi:hypothetical protein
MIPDRDAKPLWRDADLHHDRRLGRRILRRIFEHMGQRSGGQQRIELDQDIRVDVEVEAMPAKGEIDLVASRLDDLGGMHPSHLR